LFVGLLGALDALEDNKCVGYFFQKNERHSNGHLLQEIWEGLLEEPSRGKKSKEIIFKGSRFWP